MYALMDTFTDYYNVEDDFWNSMYKKIFTRVFKENVANSELVWHRDKNNRVIKVVWGTGWKLQMDNQLPYELEVGQNYHINKETFHRLHKGNSELKLEIKEYD